MLLNLKIRAHPGTHWLRVLVLSLLLCSLPVIAQKAMEEQAIKAAYLEKFVHYVQWPDTSIETPLSEPGSPGTFTIAILGQNPFGRSMEVIYKLKKINDQDLIVRFIDKVEESLDADLLFIASSERKKLDLILKFTSQHPILTVGDTKGYAEKGVMINLIRKRNQIRFEINNAAATRVGIEINFRLLSLAFCVYSE